MRVWAHWSVCVYAFNCIYMRDWVCEHGLWIRTYYEIFLSTYQKRLHRLGTCTLWKAGRQTLLDYLSSEAPPSPTSFCGRTWTRGCHWLALQINIICSYQLSYQLSWFRPATNMRWWFLCVWSIIINVELRWDGILITQIRIDSFRIDSTRTNFRTQPWRIISHSIYFLKQFMTYNLENFWSILFNIHFTKQFLPP